MTSRTLAGPRHWRLMLWGAIAALYLLPVTAMLLNADAHWTAFDFAAAAVLLVGLGVAIELAVRFAPSTRARVVLGGSAVLCVALIWAEGAVGLFD
ncbi:hypothetical protein [Sphingomonas sp. Y38-1Y]|uniref:hypothetical protein n=1 Tax=Sphingomonas sp. Y38-1Y TaxID=3078265 RepID=UPI0028E9021C|nr:hypothetical protein [Sphingomonas sp. Y38-1Y]